MRHDVCIDADARSFSLASVANLEQHAESILADVESAARRGLIIGKKLHSDDGCHVRVLVGELEGAEREWVGRLVGALSIPDGRLQVMGGLCQDAFDDESTFHRVEVEPGDHRVEIYSYFGGCNGDDFHAASEQEGPPWGAWFRESRPGEAMPAWLKMVLFEEPEEDPGFESEWEAEDEDELDDACTEEQVVDFVIRLVKGAEVDDRTPTERGVSPLVMEVRRPERFPLAPIVGREP
ncbi:MAG: hypothetical protein AAF533_23795 [Acidobacteriota bacterium]